ncbi:group III truncated hemoglobin [Pseudoxanthomonas beigongshangi]|uniref:group III truncated hemoglobin n=1 Tax=Pseudoxanthomonas beigongshangi TaxID=2782537 RepID=UPI00193B810A|nr:group III truncated hemoglobin [Pseudoxanthomonas beigongshangi]
MRIHPPEDGGPGLGLCSEAEVVRLVETFYLRVRRDDLLGHFFEKRVRDWAAHHSLLVAFWSSLLRGTRRFHGAPVGCHLGMAGLTEAMFLRWLALFRQTTADCGNEAMRHEADDAALRMANHFWQRYQARQLPTVVPSPLPVS